MDFKDFQFEIGVAVAILTIVIVGKAIFGGGGNDNKKRKNEEPSEVNKKPNAGKEEVNTTQTQAAESDYVEGVVAKLSELEEGKPTEVPLGEGQVLVVKDKKEVYATANKCAHAALPLKNGAYCDGRIRCPWHGACFNMKTGDIEDFPCVDGIHAYDVKVENDNVIVKAPKSAFKNFRKTPTMAKADDANTSVVVIIGAGPAGLVCAETLRQEGFKGKIVMIGKEPHLPYDRTKLSKVMTVKASEALLRQPEFFAQNKIETMLGQEVTELDPEAKTVTLKDGKVIKYDNVVIATGGDPRTLPAPGMNLANIFQVRVPEDAAGIVSNYEGKKVVIVGTSFIGMEAAAYIAKTKKAASIVAIGMESVPFERVLGEKVGAALLKLHQSNGVDFRLKRVVKEFIGEEGKVTAVILDDGERLEADTVIIGAGIIPATKFVKKDSLKMARDGSILADKYLKAADSVWVAGDLARYPYHLTGEEIRVEHYGMSMYQGKTVAQNIMGKSVACTSIPFFWTNQYAKSVRYAGHALSWDTFLTNGSVDDLAFTGYFVRKGEITAVVTVGVDTVAAVAAELYQHSKMPSAEALQARNFDLASFLKQ